MNQSIAHLDESGQVRELASPEGHQASEVRMNDGAGDPWGRFWIGSMAFSGEKGRGSLYRFHESTGTETVFGDVTISNGMGWSPDERTMYYVDSGPGTISAFDVDRHGEIAGRRLVAQLNVKEEGTPDGLCIDAEGAIWVAIWGGYQVRRYSPSGDYRTSHGVDRAAVVLRNRWCQWHDPLCHDRARRHVRRRPCSRA